MLYILLPVHNRSSITRSFLENIASQKNIDLQSIHVLLVDDGCTDDTVAEAKKTAANKFQITIIKGSGNLYWGGGLHVGWKEMRNLDLNDDDLLMISNDDNTMPKDYLSNVFAYIRKLKIRKFLLVASRSLLGSKKDISPGVIYNRKNNDFIPTEDLELANCVNTQSLFMYAREFMQLGGFHPFFIPHFMADYEFTLRACRKGFRLLSAKDIRIQFRADTTLNMSYPRNMGLLKRIVYLFSPRNSENMLACMFIAARHGTGIYRFYLPIKIMFSRIWWRVLRYPKLPMRSHAI